MKKEQFDESVNRSLYQASRNLEMNETLRYLEKDVKETERKAYTQDSVMVDGLDGTIKHSHQFLLHIFWNHALKFINYITTKLTP